MFAIAQTEIFHGVLAEPQSVEVLVVSPVVASYVLNSTWFARSGGLKHRFGESSHFW